MSKFVAFFLLGLLSWYSFLTATQSEDFLVPLFSLLIGLLGAIIGGELTRRRYLRVQSHPD